ncbi:sensor domain-containing diguanylate cyclase [Blastococcus sp. KM273129]|uniref:sensor domain-containing diguanylate cyclase n=1 Tax=Blastococcus sp. KM273129 TaxID=2570315 RepID=UPI001F3325D6|nr:sensor domain-containing diguanylate cyclase [Blastococcus sp. KM273129]
MTTSPTSAPAARAAWLHTALVVLVIALVVVVVPEGPWRPAAEIVLYALGLAGVVTALRRHRTPLVVAWSGLAAALALFALSCVADVAALAGLAPGISAPLETALDVAAYAALVVGALGVVRAGRRRRDWASWTDTLTLLLAAGLILLAVQGDRHAHGSDFVEVNVGTPLLTAVLLIVCLPLALTRGRTVTTAALFTAAALAVAAYGGAILTGTTLRGSAVLDPVSLLPIAALCLAGRHPSVVALGPAATTGRDATFGRVVAVGAVLLVNPAVLVLWTVDHGGIGYVLGAGSAVLSGLALWRLLALSRERERTRAALAASEERLRVLLENAADVIAIVDAEGSVAYMSPAVRSLLGRPPADYVGRDAISLADPRDQPRLRAAVAAAGRSAGGGSGVVDTDIRVQHSSGGTRWVEMRISGRVDAVGIEGWVVNFREVTDRKLFEEELRRQARTDPLTGLLNRTAFNERLEAAAAGAGPGSCPAVLFIDVDDFKDVNDTLGHAAGDELLLAVAGRLSADVRGEDVVARLGGDEFALLLADADAALLREVAERLLTALRAPVRVGTRTTTVTASIGGALGTAGCTAEELLHRADTAMYAAKRTGKDSCALLGAAEDALP